MTGLQGWAIQPLAGRHVRDHFDSREPALDDFLKRYARQNENRSISRTYVAVRGSDPKILGYYTLRTGAVDVGRFPPAEVRRFPRYPVPVIHLARLAVDRGVQGQGVGEMLLASSLKKALLASQIIGVFAVEVRAKTPEAKAFYEKHGFRAFSDEPQLLYLPAATIGHSLK